MRRTLFVPLMLAALTAFPTAIATGGNAASSGVLTANPGPCVTGPGGNCDVLVVGVKNLILLHPPHKVIHKADVSSAIGGAAFEMQIRYRDDITGVVQVVCTDYFTPGALTHTQSCAHNAPPGIGRYIGYLIVLRPANQPVKFIHRLDVLPA